MYQSLFVSVVRGNLTAYSPVSGHFSDMSGGTVKGLLELANRGLQEPILTYVSNECPVSAYSLQSAVMEMCVPRKSTNVPSLDL